MAQGRVSLSREETRKAIGGIGVVRRCPQCGSPDIVRLWRESREDGKKFTEQFWKCQSCGHQFPQPAIIPIEGTIA